MKRALSIALVTAQFSCASLTASSMDHLRVNASPEQATVRVNGVERGQAPMEVEVSKRGHTFVDVTAPGHHTSPCSTEMSANGGYIAADIALCLLLFPIGCISFIDADGAWNQLESPQCDVVLTKRP